MFETHDSTEMPIPEAFKEPGERAWACINFRLHMHWFYVAYSLHSLNEGNLHTIGFFIHPEQIIDLKNSQGIKITEANIVTPGHLNKKERWDMEPLAEIWRAMEPDTEHPQYAYIFILNNGNKYVDSAPITPEEELIDPKLIFRTRN